METKDIEVRGLAAALAEPLRAWIDEPETAETKKRYWRTDITCISNLICHSPKKENLCEALKDTGKIGSAEAIEKQWKLAFNAAGWADGRISGLCLQQKEKEKTKSKTKDFRAEVQIYVKHAKDTTRMTILARLEQLIKQSQKKHLVTLKVAVENYNVSRATLKRKLKELNSIKKGGLLYVDSIEVATRWNLRKSSLASND